MATPIFTARKRWIVIVASCNCRQLSWTFQNEIVSTKIKESQFAEYTIESVAWCLIFKNILLISTLLQTLNWLPHFSVAQYVLYYRPAQNLWFSSSVTQDPCHENIQKSCHLYASNCNKCSFSVICSVGLVFSYSVFFLVSFILIVFIFIYIYTIHKYKCIHLYRFQIALKS